MVHQGNGCTWNVSDDSSIKPIAYGSFTLVGTANYTDTDGLQDAFSAWMEYILFTHLVNEKFSTKICELTFYKESNHIFKFVIVLEYMRGQLEEYINEIATNLQGKMFSFIHREPATKYVIRFESNLYTNTLDKLYLSRYRSCGTKNITEILLTKTSVCPYLVFSYTEVYQKDSQLCLKELGVCFDSMFSTVNGSMVTVCMENYFSSLNKLPSSNSSTATSSILSDQFSCRNGNIYSLVASSVSVFCLLISFLFYLRFHSTQSVPIRSVKYLSLLISIAEALGEIRHVYDACSLPHTVVRFTNHYFCVLVHVCMNFSSLVICLVLHNTRKRGFTFRYEKFKAYISCVIILSAIPVVINMLLHFFQSDKEMPRGNLISCEMDNFTLELYTFIAPISVLTVASIMFHIKAMQLGNSLQNTSCVSRYVEFTRNFALLSLFLGVGWTMDVVNRGTNCSLGNVALLALNGMIGFLFLFLFVRIDFFTFWSKHLQSDSKILKEERLQKQVDFSKLSLRANFSGEGRCLDVNKIETKSNEKR